MATPNYLGSGQPVADSETGVLGRIGAFFGMRTSPAYAAAPVPTASSASSSPGAVTPPPAGSTAPSGSTDEPMITNGCTCVCHVDLAQPADPCLPGRIAIIVPRRLPMQDE